MNNLHGRNYYKTVVRNLKLIVKCGICGHKQKLQFHHIKPTKLNGEGRGSAQRCYDIVKHPDCYIPLCYFCHRKVSSEDIIIVDDIPMIPMWWTNGMNSGAIHVI